MHQDAHASSAGDAEKPIISDPVQDRLAEPVDAEQPPRLPFPVVGIGASAGGLEAFTEFFKYMPTDAGMAFILIQHLPPTRESLMADILGKRTDMPVHQVVDGMPIEPDHVYVIRPGHTMTVRDGALHLGAPLEEPGHRRPVDDFFRSLAAEQRQRAICIVMSGMGSNGAAGAQSIHAVGGVCIAQDPETAAFGSMPRAVIDAGHADFILAPRDMADFLTHYSTHPYVRDHRPATIAEQDRETLVEILAILRTRSRHDFSGYKKPTVLRRVQRRMGLNRVSNLKDYSQILRQNPNEVSSLIDDLMIHVTGFFRDPRAWETLAKRVMAPMIEDKEEDGSIRVWVTACSSGEEAYSIAILLAEAAENAKKRFDIKIFATDTIDRVLSLARAGIFPAGIEAEVSQERLDRFFEKSESTYRVRKELREMVVFAPQNVAFDPPFSRIDLCTCRNLLIYLEPSVQRRVLSLLHFGLREGGTLFLGNSETISGAEDLFEPIDKTARIYRRVGPTQNGLLNFPTPPGVRGRAGDAPVLDGLSKSSIAQLTHRTLLQEFAPAAVTIDRQSRVVYFHGDTERFLINPRGEPTRDLMQIVRDPIRSAVRSALQQVTSLNTKVAVRDGFINVEGVRHRVEIVAAPLELAAHRYFLVSFVLLPAPAADIPDGETREQQDGREVREELARTRHELQSTIEDLQASNEEMKASNEEITSINEELQSTNEELETSKEELQSLNEELTTVNNQLHAKMEELEATTSDLASLLSSTDIAVIFLDTSLRVRRFTPAVRDLFDLILTDIGRPLTDLACKFEDDDLTPDVKRVLEKLVPAEKEIRSESGKWYMRRVLPYRTSDNRIDGVVITFVDISARREARPAFSSAVRRSSTSCRSASW